jgi:hypothetical protein
VGDAGRRRPREDQGGEETAKNTLTYSDSPWVVRSFAKALAGGLYEGGILTCGPAAGRPRSPRR